MVLQVEKIWKRSNTSHCHTLPLTILSSPQAGRFSLGDTGGMLNMVGDGSLELADQDREVWSQNHRNVTCQINGLILATLRIHGPGRGNNHKLLWMSGIKTTEPQTTWCCKKKYKMAHTTPIHLHGPSQRTESESIFTMEWEEHFFTGLVQGNMCRKPVVFVHQIWWFHVKFPFNSGFSNTLIWASSKTHLQTQVRDQPCQPTHGKRSHFKRVARHIHITLKIFCQVLEQTSTVKNCPFQVLSSVHMSKKCSQHLQKHTSWNINKGSLLLRLTNLNPLQAALLILRCLEPELR
jgi:hypothetical protein